jgi:hypothetical protein
MTDGKPRGSPLKLNPFRAQDAYATVQRLKLEVALYRFPTSKQAITLGLFAAVLTLSASNSTVALTHEENLRQFTVEIGPVDLTGTAMAHMDHGTSHSHSTAVTPPVAEVRIPVSGYLNGFKVAITDAAGNEVPSDVIHHLNFIDPENRELFLPISQRMLAVGKETGSHSFPKMLFGFPLRSGQAMVVSAMLHNPHPADYKGVTVRVTFEYSPTHRPWPLFRVYPFQLDVLFPTGDKSFDLPPGRSERSYEGSPAIDGRIMAMSGHVHENALSLTLSDVTTGQVIWTGKPALDAKGNVASMPIANFSGRMGVKLYRSHKYRVTVAYINPTSDTVRAGGMGVVGGIFLPGIAVKWPKADQSDLTYTADRKHYLRATTPDK